MGGGLHYLADASPYRDAGTTNVPAVLRDTLKKTTTYPPVQLASIGSTLAADTTLSPQAQRDTDIPDLGAHYYPIDYVAGIVFATNCTLQVDPGTVIAAYNPSNTSYYGLAVGKGAKLYCNGLADNKINVTHYSTVQETAPTNWAGPMLGLLATWNLTPTPELRCRFTDFSVPATAMRTLNGYAGATWKLNDCQFYSGTLGRDLDLNVAIIATNCLFHRVFLCLYTDDSTTNAIHNITYHGGHWEAYWGGGNTVVTFSDNLFAGTDFNPDFTPYMVPSSHNGYTTNCTGGYLTTNASDVVVNSLVFQSGTLGRFYLPTTCAFMDAGTTNADLLGFWHFTTSTNNVNETNSLIQIGFHYVATDTSGVPLDYDGDGTPDYVEDANGNGSVDSGETDWKNAGDWGLRVFITRPRKGSPIP